MTTLFVEKSVSRRFYSTLFLPVSFLLLLSVFLELSVRLRCDEDVCVMSRATVFSERNTNEFRRQELQRLVCIGSSYGPETAQGKCHLGFALKGTPDVHSFFHFDDGLKAIMAAEELKDLFPSRMRISKSASKGFYASYHGSIVGKYAEGMSYLSRFLCLVSAISVAAVAISLVVPYRREWKLSKAGVLAGYDCFIHTQSVWRGSFWTLSNYKVSIESKEVFRNGMTYGIYWLSLAIGTSKSTVGEVVRNDADLRVPLRLLKHEIDREQQETSDRRQTLERIASSNSLNIFASDEAYECDDDEVGVDRGSGKRNSPSTDEVTLKKRRVAAAAPMSVRMK